MPRALLCRTWGPIEGLELAHLPPATPGPGEVVVTMKAVALNFPDVLVVQGKYQFKPPFPFAPGSELSGVVNAVGAGVSRFRPGDEVIGVPLFGALADEVVVPQERLMHKPAGMPWDVAAALTISHGTTLHALKDRAALQAGETLLVLGAAGGTGLAAIELGKVMGARVIAAASTPDKLDLCRRTGADEVIDYSREDLKERVRELTGGRGADVIYDPVGGPYAEPALRAIAWNGRYLVIGFAHGDIPKLPLNLLLLKGCAAVGVFWGDFVRREPERNEANMRELFSLVADGRISPHVSGHFTLETAVDALRLIAARLATGKIIVKP